MPIASLFSKYLAYCFSIGFEIFFLIVIPFTLIHIENFLICNKLLKENKSDEQIAELYYYLCTVAPKNQAYLLQAQTWYSKLVRLFPSHKNLSRLQELNQLKDANG